MDQHQENNMRQRSGFIESKKCKQEIINALPCRHGAVCSVRISVGSQK
jgi:hypothetical protein